MHPRLQENSTKLMLPATADAHSRVLTGTVGTCMDHPNQGKTQLFRRDQTLDSLSAIFKNPRVHTGMWQ